jgi:hypothetical protein
LIIILTDHVVIDYAQDTMLDFSKIHSNRVLFIRRYFPILVKVYRRLRIQKRVKCENTLDKFLTSDLSARVIFPVGNKVYELVRKISFLDR